MSSALAQRQQDELAALASIFRPDELTVSSAEGGVFRAHVRTPTGLLVRAEGGVRERVDHLPPLVLHFTLPPGYPESEPPTFMLAGHWLSRRKMSRLCRQLDQLFEPGQETLFTWFSFLQDETWAFLSLPNVLDISALSRPPRRTGNAGQTTGAIPTDNIPANASHTKVSPEDWVLLDSPSSAGAIRTSLVPASNAVLEGKEDSEVTLDVTKDNVESEVKLDVWRDKEESEVTLDVWREEERGTEQDGDRPRKRPAQRSTGCDFRAIVEVAPAPGLLGLLLAHSAAQARADFDRASQECAVCMSAWLGSQCALFTPCLHVVCMECAGCYLREAATRGVLVTCPGSECSAPFPHHLARQLLSEEEFQRYDGRLLEGALAALADIVRCPRSSCQYAVTRDPEDDKLATCFHCRYAFCVDCRQGYHGVEPCRFRPDDQMRLIAEYTDGSAEERAVLEKRYGRRRLEGLVQASLTKTWLEDNSKPCPHCRAGIEKAFGCNKMVCWRCNTHFCWLCAKQLDPAAPYAHYLSAQSPCHRLLFQGIDQELVDELPPDEDFPDEEDLVDIEDEDFYNIPIDI